MLTIYNRNLKKTAILRNTYEVSYEKPVNQIWSAGFFVPLNDPNVKKINQMDYVEIKDTDGEYIGLYRILTRRTSVNSQGKYIKCECSHVLSTLMDSTIPGYKQTQRGWTTRAVIEFILSFQDVKNWRLGRCDFDRLFEYSFENQNGLADALFSITEVFAEDFMWTWDTTSYPWTINLIKPDSKPTCRVREGWNLRALEVEESPLKLINHLTALGKGDGINNVNFKRINGGKDYVEDLSSQSEYGLIEYIWKDERFTSEESLLASAQAMLDRFKRPIVTWKITAADLIKAIPNKSTMRVPKIDELRSGKVVQLWTTLFGVVNLRIVNEKKSDLFGDPGNIELEIGYIGEDINSSLADIERRMEIYKLSSVGATNKDTTSFADNCDADFPQVIPFYCEDELKRINKVLLTFKTEPYRAYSRATKGGGAIVQATAGGGGIVKATSGGGAIVKATSAGGYTAKSTASGGSSVQSSTSESGGGSTSSAGGDHNHLMFTYFSKLNQDAEVKDVWKAGSTDQMVGMYSFHGGSPDLYTAGSSGNHNHTVPAHTHRVSIDIPAHSHNFEVPNHSHDVNLPDHTHQVDLPNHSHDITLPDHIHDIDYGIYQDTNTPKKVEVRIDDKLVTTITETSVDRLDIAEFLYKDTDGKISRGWHEITIKPIGARARFVGQCTVYGFIGATEGGEF